MYKPNLQLPLASSYQERGVAGFTNTVTNRLDQQKVNCFYEVSKNSITGAGKLDLTKRPGVTLENLNSIGSATQVSYLLCPPSETVGVGGLVAVPWVFSRNGDDLIAASDSATTTIFSASAAAAFAPCFIDQTLLSATGQDTVVVQFRRRANIAAANRIFFSNLISSFTEITDGDFTGLTHIGKLEHMDGFAFILEIKNKIYNSDLNSLANWTSTNFITKQIKQDFPVGLARLNNQILAFGDNTVEAFYNAGNATGSPLLPIKQLHQRIGLVQMSPIDGGHYYAIVENRIYFVGRRSGGLGSVGVFSYNGSTFEKVSTSFIDKILSEQCATSPNAIFSINALGFHGQSAISISLTAPATATQRWLMFFPDWKDWFEWSSTVFSPINNGQFFLGITPNAHRVYKFLAADNWQDNGTNFTMQSQFKLPQDGHQRKRMAEFGVLADTARSTNMLSVEFSNDDYVSFVNIGAIDLARDIKTLNRGGSYRQRAVRLSSTNALETRLSAFVARIE